MPMRQGKHRSALPVYIAAAVYAVWALVLPLYTFWHFLAAALVTAAVWLVADRLIKPKVEYVPEPEPEPVSYGTEVDKVLAAARDARAEMDRAAAAADPAVREKIGRLADLSDRIAHDAVDDAADVPAIQRFQNRFLPTTLSLLGTYSRLCAQGTAGENIAGAKEKILQMLDTELAAFQKQLDALYQNDAIDVDAEIKAMESLLHQEGLTGQDDTLEDILRREEAARQNCVRDHET